jgi:hypothetical protein
VEEVHEEALKKAGPGIDGHRIKNYCTKHQR